MRKYYISIMILFLIIILPACGFKDKEASALVLPSTGATSTTTADRITPIDIQTAETITTQVATNSVKEVDKKKSDIVIVIDAGHQAHQNSEREPIGPGAEETKAKVSSGTQGTYTKKAEYKVNLEVSLKLRDILMEQGYQVVMIRETNKVDISNAERAKIANKAKADVFVRIHCNGSTKSSVHGILTLCPTKNNPYCGEIYKKSRSLSDSVISQVCKATGAKNRGVTETDTMSGINWSKVPVTIIEMGYMTNKSEDIKLSDTDYQDKLAKGIAEGIKAYLD